VIGGKAKGRKLKLVPGDSTRPVRDMVKEALFNILGQWVEGTVWLDLFAGTGSVGIEALSRGAARCLFLDTSRTAVRTIHENLALTGLHTYAEVRRADAFTLLSNDPGPEEQSDLIYIAPPQYKGMWRRALALVDARPEWLQPGGLAVVQIDPQEYEEAALGTLHLADQRTYGNTMLCFYERRDEESADE
jgi:16S rRNA (guanine(966)-N(2))-methyltransferase RsmD